MLKYGKIRSTLLIKLRSPLQKMMTPFFYPTPHPLIHDPKKKKITRTVPQPDGAAMKPADSYHFLSFLQARRCQEDGG